MSTSAGTWQDSTADSSGPASNVTRFSRALSANAIVERNGQKDEIPQIVYYQKGVGTGLGDKYWGGTSEPLSFVFPEAVPVVFWLFDILPQYLIRTYDNDILQVSRDWD